MEYRSCPRGLKSRYKTNIAKMEKEYNYGSAEPNSLYDFVREQLMYVDTAEFTDEVDGEVKIDITPEKVYFWTRLYINEEDPSVKIGDTVNIVFLPSGERLETKFIAYGKKGLERNHEGEVTNYNPEDDTRILCLMIEESTVNNADDIPFLRTLFKLGRHYEYQLVRRSELVFVKQDGGHIDYYDCEF